MRIVFCQFRISWVMRRYNNNSRMLVKVSWTAPIYPSNNNITCHRKSYFTKVTVFTPDCCVLHCSRILCSYHVKNKALNQIKCNFHVSKPLKMSAGERIWGNNIELCWYLLRTGLKYVETFCPFIYYPLLIDYTILFQITLAVMKDRLILETRLHLFYIKTC